MPARGSKTEARRSTKSPPVPPFPPRQSNDAIDLDSLTQAP
jgi:hypothetical protein